MPRTAPPTVWSWHVTRSACQFTSQLTEKTACSNMKQLVILGILLQFCSSCFCLDNGLARTPQMGWNSWNHFHCGISQDIVEKTADAFISKGLYKFGYQYVNIDDCWQVSRDANGTIQPDPKTFPDFQKMIDYVHSKGLKFGLYSDAGYKTCAGIIIKMVYCRNYYYYMLSLLCKLFMYSRSSCFIGL